MKYIFATVLVLVALVSVFHPERIIPVPRAVSSFMTTSLARHLPFSVKTEYAESCLDGLRGERGRIRYKVSGTAVNLQDLERRLVETQQARSESLRRIQLLVDAGQDTPEEALAAELARYDRLDQKSIQLSSLLDRTTSTFGSLEEAETEVSDKIGELQDRLELVQLDHVHNDARELAAKLTDAEFPGKAHNAYHCSEVLDGLEHQERVRGDLYHRYGPKGPLDIQGSGRVDPWERAREILETNC